MHDERFLPIGSGDPLRYIDSRFEPHDPIFDAEEPVLGRPRRRRKGRAAAAMIAATLACGGTAKPAIHATDSILVQLEPGAAPPATTASDDWGPPIVALPAVSEEEGPLLRIPLQPGADAAAAADEAARQAGVSFAEPVYVYRASKTPDDPRFKDLWGIQQIDAPDAWARTVGDRDVTVAIVDDGIALDHPDLKPNLWVNPDEIAGNGTDDDGDGIVDDIHGANFVDSPPTGDPSAINQGEAPYHGSHVSGTIGAAGNNRAGVVGVNWKVSLMAVRALGPQGGRSDDLAKAIDYAVDHGARVINASWGGGGASQVLSKAIERAGKHGVLFVAAAGNDSAAKPDFPASVGSDNVISVAATMPDDSLASFSNRGALMAAPGVGILSTTSPGQYERYDGTSMASPHVAGVAALLWSAYPDATLAQVRKAIFASGVPVAGVRHGRVDAARALQALADETGGDQGGLQLSRDTLNFTARAGRIPRSQTVSLRADGGGARTWTAKAGAAWIVLPKTSGKTPSRVTVGVDTTRLGAGKHEGKVVFSDSAGGSVSLSVALQIGNLPSVVVQGKGCELRDDGALHVQVGAGCALSAAEGESNGVQWRLPGGTETTGARLYGQYVRRGQFQVLVSRDEGEVDPIAVIVE